PQIRPPFPTRRSSDLAAGAARRGASRNADGDARSCGIAVEGGPDRRRPAARGAGGRDAVAPVRRKAPRYAEGDGKARDVDRRARSEEHTSELQSLAYL